MTLASTPAQQSNLDARGTGTTATEDAAKTELGRAKSDIDRKTRVERVTRHSTIALTERGAASFNTHVQLCPILIMLIIVTWDS